MLLFFLLAFVGVVRAQITTLDALSNEKAYEIKGERGFIAGNEGYVMGSNHGPISGHTFDATNLDHQFAILKNGENYYLYNVGAEMFAAKSGNKAMLTPYPVHTIAIEEASVNTTDYDWIIKLNSKYLNLSSSSDNGVYTNYDTEDGGNRWSIKEIAAFDYTNAMAVINLGLAQERQDLYEECLASETVYNSISNKEIQQAVVLKGALDNANSLHASDQATIESLNNAKATLIDAVAQVEALTYNLLFEFDLTKQKFRLKNASTNLYMTVVEKESGNQDKGGVQIKTEGDNQFFYFVMSEDNKYKIKSTDGAYLTSFSYWGYKATETEADACNHSLGYIGDGKYTIESPLGLVGSNNGATSDGSVMYSNHTADKSNIYWILEPIYDAKIGENDYYATLADAVEAAEPGDEITLLADIDLTGKDWTPFGATPETAFQGTIDGNSKIITGLSGGTDKAGKVPFGLIAYATGNVTVKDLYMDNVNINSGEYASAVMGLYIGAQGDDKATYAVNFENITVSGAIVGTDKPAAILGCTYSSSYTGSNKNITFNFTNCTNNASISGTGRVGGIAGAISGQFAKDLGGNEIKITFDKCTNTGVISSTSTTYKTGGIVGWMGSYGNYEFTSCTNSGDANGALAGRFHFAGAIQKIEVPTDMLTFDLNTLNLYDNASEKRISVTWSWETNIGVVNESRYTQTTYYVGNTLSDNEWRLTIDGEHYRAPFNMPIDFPDSNTVPEQETWTQETWAKDTKHLENQLPTAESCNVIGYVFEQTSETSYLYTKKSAGQYVSDVAKIGENYYATALSALMNAKDGDVVTFLKGKHTLGDLTHQHFYANSDKSPENLTIQGDEGKEVVVDKLYFNTLTFPKNLTVKNLVIDGEGAGEQQGLSSATAVSGLTVDGCTFKNGAYLSLADKVAENITVKNCTFVGTGNEQRSSAVYIQKVKNLTIGSNSISDGFYNAIQCSSSTDGTVNITKNTISGTNDRAFRFGGNIIGTVNIVGNTITDAANDDEEVFKATNVSRADGGQVEFSENTYNGKPWNPATIYSGTDVVCKSTFAALAGDKGYDTLQGAIDGAAAGQTVKLVNDVVVDKAISVDKLVTLDFNEFNITRADGYDGYVFEVTGDLPMINGGLGQNIEKGATCYIINDNDYKTEEGKTFALKDNQMVDIEYNRTFGHTDYQVLYVPFAIPFNNIKDDFDVYSITNISDVVELTQITYGTLEANVPYMIKAKEAGDKTIKVSYELLLSNPTEYTQVLGDYTITGTYTSKAIEAGQQYVLTNGEWCQLSEAAVTNEQNILGAFRVYLTASGENTPSEVRFVINNSDATAIDELKVENGNVKAEVYDLSGRRVEKAEKGIFVVNGKKVVK